MQSITDIYFEIFEQNCRKFVFQAPFRGKCGGGGAPLRNATGHIITKYRDDPSIAFCDSARKHVENHLRYKTSNEEKKQYKMDLDRCRADRMRRDVKNSLDMVGFVFFVLFARTNRLIQCFMYSREFGVNRDQVVLHGAIHEKLVNHS